MSRFVSFHSRLSVPYKSSMIASNSRRVSRAPSLLRSISCTYTIFRSIEARALSLGSVFSCADTSSLYTYYSMIQPTCELCTIVIILLSSFLLTSLALWYNLLIVYAKPRLSIVLIMRGFSTGKSFLCNLSDSSNVAIASAC